FTVQTSVQAQVTGPALTEMFGELDRISKGDITPEELTKAMTTVRDNTVSSFASLSGLVGVAGGAVTDRLGGAPVSRGLSELSNDMSEELNALAKRSIHLEGGVLVMVGDRATVEPQLENVAGMPKPVYVDTTGNPAAK